MLKKDSKAWKIASKRARRKYAMAYPLDLLDNGDVLMCSRIRGNTWTASLQELELLETKKFA